MEDEGTFYARRVIKGLLRLLILALSFSVLYACGRQAAQYSSPGTLYVQYDDSKFTEIHDGKVVGKRPLDFVVARERPGRSLVASNLSACQWENEYGHYALSPNGSHALCTSDGDGYLRLFDPGRPRSQRIVLKDYSTNANDTSFAWIDDRRFVAMILDDTCPKTHLYDFYPTRVITFSRRGDRFSSGPCALGVVTGSHRTALLGEAANGLLWHVRDLFAVHPADDNDGYDRFHLTWSVDNGKTWHEGVPIVFDGNDVLLYREPFTDYVRTENGQIAFTNAENVKWSR